jgi:hypothetical protein
MQVTRKAATQIFEKGRGNRARSAQIGTVYRHCQTRSRPLSETRIISLGERLGIGSPVTVNGNREHEICISLHSHRPNRRRQHIPPKCFCPFKDVYEILKKMVQNG